MVVSCFFLSKQKFEIPEEEAEWVGLSLEEAVEKQRLLEHKVKKKSFGLSVKVMLIHTFIHDTTVSKVQDCAAVS